MNILIRNAKPEDYEAVESIMRQVHRMHVDWRPDIYKYNEPVLPQEMYAQALKDETFFVAKYNEVVAGILFIQYQRIENPNLLTRNIIFVDSMAVDENYRGRGIGHAFFDFLKKLKLQKGCDGIELQVKALNKAAYKMYTDYGFRESSVNMELL